MKLHEIKPNSGAIKRKKRVGRGPGSGHGKTSCKGDKGARARSGGKKGPGFEGGQMPLHRRLPKRGFTNIFKVKHQVVNIDSFADVPANTVIDPEYLLLNGFVKNLKEKIKILGTGELSGSFTVKAHFFSKTAKEKIEKVGGKVEVI